MSFAATAWVWQQHAPSGTAKCVLLYLANCANKVGESFPSIADICLHSQHGERAVRQAIKDLCAAGLITACARFAPNGRCSSTLYQLAMAKAAAKAAGRRAAATPDESQGYAANKASTDPSESMTDSDPDHSRHSAGAEQQESLGLEGCETAGVTPAKRQGGPLLNSRRILSLNQERESLTTFGTPHARTRANGGGGPRQAEAAEAVDRIRAAWNAMAAASGLAAIRVLSGDRLRHLAARLREVGEGQFLEAIGKVGASAFCHGANDRAWTADFDFMLQPASLTRALEGRYDDRKVVPLRPVRSDRPLRGQAAYAAVGARMLAELDARIAAERATGADHGTDAETTLEIAHEG